MFKVNIKVLYSSGRAFNFAATVIAQSELEARKLALKEAHGLFSNKCSFTVNSIETIEAN